MGNSAKVASICSGSKKVGKDCGSKNIFVCFGHQHFDYCYIDKYQEINASLTVDAAAQIISELAQNTQSIYFCGAQPLQRYDWLERLHKKNWGLAFKLITQVPDSLALAKCLHFVDSTSLQVAAVKGELREYKKFLLLANLKNISVQLQCQQMPLPEFEKFIKMVASVEQTMQVFLDSRGDLAVFTEYYALASKYLLAAGALPQVNFEVKHENFNQQ